MISLSLSEIAGITGGTLHDVPDPAVRLTGPAVCDSREAGPGGLFAAIVGEHADGHDFADAAVAAGAVCVLASRPVGVPAVLVGDVTAALGMLARETRRANRGDCDRPDGERGQDLHQGPAGSGA